MSKLFRVKNVGLDTRGIDYMYFGEKYDIVHTSISENNDYLIRNTLDEDTKLITSIDFLDNSETAIYNHLDNLDKGHIDLLLIDSKCDFEKYKGEIIDLMKKDIVLEIGIENPEGVEKTKDLIELYGNSGIKVTTIAMSICPLDFDYSIIKWATESGISVVGFNPFGGRLSSSAVIDSFGVTYLLNFISTYCDTVFLSGRSTYESKNNIGYIKTIIGKETSEMYDLKKSISKLQKPIKKVIYPSLKIDKYLTLPYENPEYIYSYPETIQGLGKEEIMIETGEECVDEVVKEVMEYLDDVHKPEDGSDLDALYLFRSTIRDYFDGLVSKLNRNKPSKRYSYYTSEARVGEKIFIFSITTEKVEKRWFSEDLVDKDINYYLLYYSEGKIVFQKIINSSEIPSKS